MVNSRSIEAARKRQEEELAIEQQGICLAEYGIPEESYEFCKNLFIPTHILELTSKYLNKNLKIQSEGAYLACLHPALVEYLQNTLECTYGEKKISLRKTVYEITEETVDAYEKHLREESAMMLTKRLSMRRNLK